MLVRMVFLHERPVSRFNDRGAGFRRHFEDVVKRRVWRQFLPEKAQRWRFRLRETEVAPLDFRH